MTLYNKDYNRSMKKDTFNRYVILLVDRATATCISVHDGRLEESFKIPTDELVPQRVRANHEDGKVGREDKIFRNIEDSLHRYLKQVSAGVDSFLRDREIDFIVIASHKEMFSKVKKTLSSPTAQRVTGQFVVDFKKPLADIVKIAETKISSD